MSALFAMQPDRQEATAPARWLRLLPQANGRSTLPFIATGAVLVVVVAQLLMGVVLANGAYQIEALETQRAQELRNQTAVHEDLVRVQSPQYIAQNAAALGMVSNSNAVYLRLSDGAVLGTPTPATGQTLAGANVPNALLAGVPLVTQRAAQAAAAAAATAKTSADASAVTVPSPAGSIPGTAATPGVAAGQAPTASVPLQGGIPAVQTR